MIKIRRIDSFRAYALQTPYSFSTEGRIVSLTITRFLKSTAEVNIERLIAVATLPFFLVRGLTMPLRRDNPSFLAEIVLVICENDIYDEKSL